MAQSTTGRLRSKPRLLIEVGVEEDGRIAIQADSFEDEVRLRLYLRHANWYGLVAALEEMLDDLDQEDEQAAA